MIKLILSHNKFYLQIIFFDKNLINFNILINYTFYKLIEIIYFNY